jgi:hypothetical protein
VEGRLKEVVMYNFLFSVCLCFFLIAFGQSASAGDALLSCKVENADTLIKIESSFFRNKKVSFNKNGDWESRKILKQNDEYIWVKTDYEYESSNKCLKLACGYDFQIELIEQGSKNFKYLRIYRVADWDCEKQSRKGCDTFKKGQRINSFPCSIKKPFN